MLKPLEGIRVVELVATFHFDVRQTRQSCV